MTNLTHSVRICISKGISFDAPSMLTVRVGKGPKPKEFIVHESFLTSHSEFFRRAMNGKWAETESRIVKLPKDNPRTFAVYLNFIYTGRLTTMRKTQEELSAVDCDTFIRHIESEYQEIFELYVLAEKLQDVSAKDAALTAAIDVTQMESSDGKWRIPSFDTCNNVYEGTPEGSPARRLITDMCSGLPMAGIVLYIRAKSVHKDFVNDLTTALDKTRPVKRGHGGNVAVRNGVKAYLEEA
ncbi:hypothetical protein CC86DRAFT_405708 [Ophiobolus disseminans]|uniref:BTB domain-containing protein n=1 Tax=Ophiobolus disseminans TaxID=1469910 RepID=A0A6A7A4B8_9PLEO|nr:hypothetical protein CC86DRAFT_405708 [Ophiobolus disseminans]